MHNFEIKPWLRKKLIKLSKKDKALYDSAIKKFTEIASCNDVNHYKNLRKPMQDFKRVHLKSPFVLVFKYDPKKDKVIFYDLEHHDMVYMQ